jgi:hypothetical protein
VDVAFRSAIDANSTPDDVRLLLESMTHLCAGGAAASAPRAPAKIDRRRLLAA